MSSTDFPADLMNILLQAGSDSRLAALRAERSEVVRHTQGSYEVLLDPSDPGGLSPAERALVALHVAEQGGHAGLARHYRELLVARDPGLESAPTPRVRAILNHTALVAASPGKASKGDLQALSDAGLTVRDIVALSQLIAFVSYQLRAAFGLVLLKGGAA